MCLLTMPFMSFISTNECKLQGIKIKIIIECEFIGKITISIIKNVLYRTINFEISLPPTLSLQL